MLAGARRAGKAAQGGNRQRKPSTRQGRGKGRGTESRSSFMKSLRHEKRYYSQTHSWKGSG